MSLQSIHQSLIVSNESPPFARLHKDAWSSLSSAFFCIIIRGRSFFCKIGPWKSILFTVASISSANVILGALIQSAAGCQPPAARRCHLQMPPFSSHLYKRTETNRANKKANKTNSETRLTDLIPKWNSGAAFIYARPVSPSFSFLLLLLHRHHTATSAIRTTHTIFKVRSIFHTPMLDAICSRI